MPYARIRLNFGTMNKAYKDFKSLPPQIDKWLTDQNAREDAENEKIRNENVDRIARGEQPKKELHRSTSCCMQASLAFNATSQPIPKTGATHNRDNTTLSDGKHYVLAVDEFRAYLTYKYGPTDKVKDLATIKGKTGVLIFGGIHIEFWDGDNILQSSAGAKKRGGNPGAVMAPGMVNSPDKWFWEIGESASTTTVTVPEWLKGWWTVYDGNYYYYFFHHDGWVNYIDQKPNPKWIPPKTVGNQGTVSTVPNGFKIVWRELGPPPATEETFIRVGWTSETEMNGTSNKYSPLFARKM